MFTVKRSQTFNPFGYRIGRGFNPSGIEVGRITSSAESLAFWRSAKPAKRSLRNPVTVLQRTYRQTLELAFIATLTVINLSVQVVRDFGVESWESMPVPIIIEVADVPATHQFRYPPPPPRPSVPVPTGSEAIPEDATIVSTEIDLTELPPPPMPSFFDNESAIFVAYDTPPSPVGGLSALYNNLEYPLIARRAGIEATIVARLLINVRGQVERVQILKGVGVELGFEEAVIAAVHKLQWRPAMQRDQAVKVWVTVPIEFSLKTKTDV